MKAPARTASFLLAAFLMCAAQTFAKTTVNLTLGHGNAPNNPKSKAAAQFAELVKEKSGGQLAVTIEGGAKLGDDLAMIIAVSSGKLDLSVNSQGPSASLVPELSAIGLPYAFSTSAKAWEVLDGPVGQDVPGALGDLQHPGLRATQDDPYRHGASLPTRVLSVFSHMDQAMQRNAVMLEPQPGSRMGPACPGSGKHGSAFSLK